MSSVRLRLAPPFFLVLPPVGLLEHLGISRSYKFAADLRIVCIDIVKEEFVRPLIGFQDRFEEDIVWQVKPGVGPADTSFHPPGSLCMGFAEKRSSVEGLLTDALA